MPGAVTQLLLDLGGGNHQAMDELMPLVYEELRRLARRQLRREQPGHALETTALVHEAYLKLVDQRRVSWQNRAHFYAVASMAMRRVLVNAATARKREKRGAGVEPLRIDAGVEIAVPGGAFDIVALDEALARLRALSERACRVVECRFFGGLNIDETAAALGIAPMTVKRDWRLAKTWLRRELVKP